MIPQPPPVHTPVKTSPLASRGLRGVGQVLFWAFTATIVAIAILVYIIPQAKAGSGLTVLTGSMRPTYDPGDVVAVKGIKAHEVCDSVKPGQVVTFMPNADDQTLITHRVVAVSARTDYEECTVTTRGDANNVDDEPVPAKAVKGVVMYRVPFVGKVINKMHQNADERNVAVGGAAMFGAAALWFISPYKRKAREPEWNI